MTSANYRDRRFPRYPCNGANIRVEQGRLHRVAVTVAGSPVRTTVMAGKVRPRARRNIMSHERDAAGAGGQADRGGSTASSVAPAHAPKSNTLGSQAAKFSSRPRRTVHLPAFPRANPAIIASTPAAQSPEPASGGRSRRVDIVPYRCSTPGNPSSRTESHFRSPCQAHPAPIIRRRLFSAAAADRRRSDGMGRGRLSGRSRVEAGNCDA